MELTGRIRLADVILAMTNMKAGQMRTDVLNDEAILTPITTLAPASVVRRLPTLDRFLPLWIFAAIALGIALGRIFPGLGTALNRVQVAGVSVPIGIGLLWMMYPVLAKVRYESIGPHIRDTKLLGTSLFFNWVLGPIVMFALAWAFLPDLP
jgi:ACR3 family arsenite efflux pump ArsB